MIAFVYGAASCGENNEPLPVQTPETDNNNSRGSSVSEDNTDNTSTDRLYQNIKVIDERSHKDEVAYGGGPIYFTEESFDGLEVVFRLRDDKGIYEIYAPSDELNLNLETRSRTYWFRVKRFVVNGEGKEFKETILSYLDDEVKDLYFFEVSNDFFKINYSEEQKLNLSIPDNDTKEDIRYEIQIDDTLPESSVDIVVIQAAK